VSRPAFAISTKAMHMGSAVSWRTWNVGRGPLISMDAARLLGEHIQTRRRKRQRGIGPKWVRHGRDILYPDGAEEEYLAGLLKKAEVERESPRRGRPRKAVR
jgi:hypothetical protein